VAEGEGADYNEESENGGEERKAADVAVVSGIGSGGREPGRRALLRLADVAASTRWRLRRQELALNVEEGQRWQRGRWAITRLGWSERYACNQEGGGGK
jgi:hypothetical protein